MTPKDLNFTKKLFFSSTYRNYSKGKLRIWIQDLEPDPDLSKRTYMTIFVYGNNFNQNDKDLSATLFVFGSLRQGQIYEGRV
jgi:hypothetical protein